MTKKKSKNLSKILTRKKLSQQDVITTNLLKKNVGSLQSAHVTTSMIQSVFSKFPKELKQADIIPAHKKSKLCKENYRLTSGHPNVSKTYEGCLYDQIADILNKSFLDITAIFVFVKVIVHNTNTIY